MEILLIDSSYNAGPESMRQVIENTKKFRDMVYPEKEIIFVLWDMREIGEVKEAAHIELAQQVKSAHGVFTVWPETYSYTAKKLKELWYNGELHSSLSSKEIGKKLKAYLREKEDKNFVILFKWSQNTIFIEEAIAIQLTPTQRKQLPRQSEDWTQKKNTFFESL